MSQSQAVRNIDANTYISLESVDSRSNPDVAGYKQCGIIGKLLERRTPSSASDDMRTETLGRWVFTEEGLTRGYLRIRGDQAEVCLGDAPSESVKAVVIPSFVNSHTHIGDSCAYPAPRGSVEDIVAPPDGYKHKLLRTVPSEKKIEAMRASASFMAAAGTGGFVDFREEGVRGLEELSQALSGCSMDHVILGRPGQMHPSDAELDSILEECDGFGISAARDWPGEELRLMSEKARAAGRVFALHASECVREDIGRILDLKPAFLVHMVSASDEDLRMCADAKVPVVVCPRSNEFFGLDPGIPRLLKSGVEVALGTDNCMISRPDMFEELKAAFRSCQGSGVRPEELLMLATFAGRKVLSASGRLLTNRTMDADFVVIRVRGEEPLKELMTTSQSTDVHAVIHGGKVRRAETCRR